MKQALHFAYFLHHVCDHFNSFITPILYDHSNRSQIIFNSFTNFVGFKGLKLKLHSKCMEAFERELYLLYFSTGCKTIISLKKNFKIISLLLSLFKKLHAAYNMASFNNH